MGLLTRVLLRLFTCSSGREPAETQQVTCPFCSVIFHPDNYRVTVKPKVKITKKIERLRRKREAGEALDRTQLKILHWFESSHNKLVGGLSGTYIK